MHVLFTTISICMQHRGLFCFEGDKSACTSAKPSSFSPDRIYYVSLFPEVLWVTAPPSSTPFLLSTTKKARQHVLTSRIRSPGRVVLRRFRIARGRDSRVKRNVENIPRILQNVVFTVSHIRGERGSGSDAGRRGLDP